MYLYGNLNGINVTFGVTVVPIQNFKLYLNILPTEKVNKGLKSLWHFECHLWGIERSGFFNGREKWAKGFENQRV